MMWGQAHKHREAATGFQSTGLQKDVRAGTEPRAAEAGVQTEIKSHPGPGHDS